MHASRMEKPVTHTQFPPMPDGDGQLLMIRENKTVRRNTNSGEMTKKHENVRRENFHKLYHDQEKIKRINLFG